MEFADAVRIVEAIQTPLGARTLSYVDFLNISKAQAIVAAEYVKIKHLIMPC